MSNYRLEIILHRPGRLKAAAAIEMARDDMVTMLATPDMLASEFAAALRSLIASEALGAAKTPTDTDASRNCDLNEVATPGRKAP